MKRPFIIYDRKKAIVNIKRKSQVVLDDLGIN